MEEEAFSTSDPKAWQPDARRHMATQLVEGFPQDPQTFTARNTLISRRFLGQAK